MSVAAVALRVLCSWAAPEVHGAVNHMAEVSGARVELVAALARRESRCTVDAINDRTGAAGLFQVMPRTAASIILGRKAARKGRRLSRAGILAPMINAQVGGVVLRSALALCKGNESHALTIYNGGGRCEDSEFSQQVLDFAAKVPGAS